MINNIEDIERILQKWNVRYERWYGTLKVYGNFEGFSVIEYNKDSTLHPIVLDGRCTDKDSFENWIFKIKMV